MGRVMLRLATPQDEELPWYSYSMLTAMNTCPTWATVTYGLRKRFSTEARATALEAGSVAHEAFAAIRLMQLRYVNGLEEHALHHTKRLFKQLPNPMDIWTGVNPDWPLVDNATQMALNAIEMSNYEDDPTDNKRTKANIEEAVGNYVLNYPLQRKVWVENEADPKSRVGIELPFELVFVNGRQQFKLIGTIDGLLWDINGNLIVHENKTAARLDSAWEAAFHMSHQITMYNVAASAITQSDLYSTVVWGVQIPQPRRVGGIGITQPVVSRNMDMVGKFADWVVGTVAQYQDLDGDYERSPRFTHSCNRYFRPCALIPFCASTREDRAEMIEEMVEVPLTPTEAALQEG